MKPRKNCKSSYHYQPLVFATKGNTEQRTCIFVLAILVLPFILRARIPREIVFHGSDTQIARPLKRLRVARRFHRLSPLLSSFFSSSSSSSFYFYISSFFVVSPPPSSSRVTFTLTSREFSPELYRAARCLSRFQRDRN